MGTLCKSENENLDLTRPVIICGKAKNSELIYEWKDSEVFKKSYTCGINSSCTLFGDKSVDFLFGSEIDGFRNLTRKYNYNRSKIKRIVVQEIAKYHGENGLIAEHPNQTYEDIQALFPSETKVFTYRVKEQLRRTDTHKEKRDLFIFEAGVSSYYYTLKWLTKIGFRKFLIFGISDAPEYSNLFVANNDANLMLPEKWYQTNFLMGLDVLRENKCSFTIVDFERVLSEKSHVVFSPEIEWLT